MLKDIAPKGKAEGLARARNLRRAMSLPEAMLWRHLRGAPCSLKFRRQHPTGGFVLDFYCSDARLAIEIDGISHDMATRPEQDGARDARLGTVGIETLRVAAAEVLRNSGDVADRIVRYAAARLPLHHPAAPGGPPPRDKLGEEL